MTLQPVRFMIFALNIFMLTTFFAACVPGVETAVPPTPLTPTATTLPSATAVSPTVTNESTGTPRATAVSYTPTKQANDTVQPAQVTLTPTPASPTQPTKRASCSDIPPVVGALADDSTGLLRVLFLSDALWLWREESETAEPISTGGPVTSYQRAPDNSSIAFVQDGDLWLWSEGEAATQRTASGGVNDLLFSSNGALIAYSRVLENDVYELWGVAVDGGPARLLATLSAAETWARHPDAVGMNLSFRWIGKTDILNYSFSPDLPGIGWGEAPPQPNFLVNAASGVALPELPLQIYYRFQETQNDQLVAGTTAESNELHLINVTNGHIELVLPLTEVTAWAFSPTGRYLLVTAPDRATALVIDTADFSQKPLQLPYLKFPYAIGKGFTLHPPELFWVDNTTFFTAIPELDGKYVLWQVKLAEDSATVLGNYSGFVFSILFSPDGRYLLVPDAEEAVLVDTTDLVQKPLSIPLQSIIPVSNSAEKAPNFWLDASHWLVILPINDDYFRNAVWRVDAASGAVAQIATYIGSYRDVFPAPDNSFLALPNSQSNGDFSLLLVDAASGEVVIYENDRSNLQFVRWINDSTHFLYRYSAPGHQGACFLLGTLGQPPSFVSTPPGTDWISTWADESRFFIAEGEGAVDSEGQQHITLHLGSLGGEGMVIGDYTLSLPIYPVFQFYLKD